MDYLAPFLILASMLAAACSFIAIIRPIARLGLGSRKRALGVLGLSFVYLCHRRKPPTPRTSV